MNRSVATSSPPVTLVGTKTTGPVADSNPQGKAEAFQATEAVAGMVTDLTVYVDSNSTATNLIAGLYTEKNGRPGTLLAQGTLTSPKAGRWNTVALPAKSLTAGSKYWIAILGTSGVLRFRDAASSTSQPRETSAQSTLTTMPSTWTTGSPSIRDRCQRTGPGSDGHLQRVFISVTASGPEGIHCLTEDQSKRRESSEISPGDRNGSLPFGLEWTSMESKQANM
jgi:hypothetical protein